MKLVIDIPESDYRYIKELQSLIIARGNCKTIQWDVINAIKNGTPYEERPKGKWITDNPLQENDDGAFRCSCCKVGSWHWGNSYHYCPNCGAQMYES